MTRIIPSLFFRGLCVFACSSLAVNFAGAQAPGAPTAAAVWSALSGPAMDASKSARVQNLTFARDVVRITLTDGTIQFAQPVNGVIFAAVFHGTGRLEAAPPNGTERHQLRLFTKEEKLEMSFSEATFSFTDNFADELAKQ